MKSKKLQSKKLQKTIDDYIDNNELNASIYQILLNLQDTETPYRSNLKKTPLEIFNQTYDICKKLEQEKHPEQTALEIWNKLRTKFLLCETHVIFSCVYVILFFAKEKKPNMQFFLTRIKQKIDASYFQEFEPLIREELIHTTTTADGFDCLKAEADKISDFNKRELFYADFLTHYKQTQNKRSLLEQISDEIKLIQLKKELSETEQHTTDREIDLIEKIEYNTGIASIKVRSVVILELLRKIQLCTAYNDLTKICKLITYLTGSSYNSVYNAMQKGVSFSKFHSKEIEEANKILFELNTSISIDINRRY